MRIVLVVGLPASGKTTWARAEAERLFRSGQRSLVVDDPRDATELHNVLRTAAAEGVAHAFVVDPHLCDARLRQAAHAQVARYGVVEEVFFRNDPEQCLENARRKDRGAKSVDGAIRRWSLGYQPPANAKAVFKPSKG
jgi:hypothetical protein